MGKSNSTELSPDAFERNLNHAKASYSNAQEVIRFVDSKTAILTGIVLVTTGLPFVLIQTLWSTDANSVLKWICNLNLIHPWLVNAEIVVALVGSICGVLSILASTNGLMSRLPVKGKHRDPHILLHPLYFLFGQLPLVNRLVTAPRPPVTCLFPLHTHETHTDALKAFRKIGSGRYSRQDILEEYEKQLESVGKILNCKIQRNRDAVSWFEVQILVYAVSAITILIVGLIMK